MQPQICKIKTFEHTVAPNVLHKADCLHFFLFSFFCFLAAVNYEPVGVCLQFHSCFSDPGNCSSRCSAASWNPAFSLADGLDVEDNRLQFYPSLFCLLINLHLFTRTFSLNAPKGSLVLFFRNIRIPSGPRDHIKCALELSCDTYCTANTTNPTMLCEYIGAQWKPESAPFFSVQSLTTVLQSHRKN